MRYFVIHETPRDVLLKYNLPPAAYNFCYNLMKTGIFDKVYSILPTNVYNYTEDLNREGMEIVYSNIRGKNKISRIIGSLVEQTKLFRLIKNNSNVWLYNITIANAFLFILLRIFKPKVKLYTIVLDFTPEDKINKLMLPLINHSVGLIKLSESELFTVENSICLPGIVQSDENYTKVEKITKDFLISGNIKEQISMISMLLPVFSELPELTLHISGHAQKPSMIRRYANNYSNIKFHGMVEYNEFLKIMDECTFLLSTRDPNEPRNLCNFPSKIMEGLLHNKIIISTIHYPQLEGIKYFVVSSDNDNFSKALQEIANIPTDKLLEYANQSEIVKERFNSSVWMQEMIKIENYR